MNTNIDEVILHVGLHKTGTTSIQKTLSLDYNNEILARQGYIYPRSWPFNHSIPIRSLFDDNPENYHINIKQRHSKKEVHTLNLKYKQDLEAELGKANQNKLIISGEGISVLPIKNLNEFKEYLHYLFSNHIKIRVLIYVRNPISWRISALQEQLKQGVINKNSGMRNVFRNRIDTFIKVFGREFVEVYDFDQAVQHESGLVGHFMSVVGFTNEDMSRLRPVRTNVSLSVIAGEILSYVNEKEPMIINHKLNRNRANGDFIPILSIRGPKFDIPYITKLELFENSREDIAWLKENYGIDYSNIEVLQTELIHPEFTEEIISDIRQAYIKLTTTFRRLLIEYLQQQISNESNSAQKLLLVGLLNELSIHRSVTMNPVVLKLFRFLRKILKIFLRGLHKLKAY